MNNRSTEKTRILDITPAQCRAARGLLGWEQSDLWQASGVSFGTICRFETERRQTYYSTRIKILDAFEAAGVEFKRGGWLRLKAPLPLVLSPVDNAGDVEQ